MPADSERLRLHDQLRRRNRARRAALDPAALAAAAGALAERIVALPAYRDARRLAAYIAIGGEIGLEAVIDDALARGKQLFLPIVRGEQMHFAPHDPGRPLRGARFGLLEPDVAENDWIEPAGLDLVLAPLTVFDADCNRIGQGGGYYDRVFSFRRRPDRAKPLLIGVAHDWQKVDRIEANPWDVPLDMVATDAGLYPAPA